MNAQKMGEHEAEIEKIKNVFLAILRDIKKDIDNGNSRRSCDRRDVPSHADALAEQKQNPLSIDDVTAMVAGQIGQLARWMKKLPTCSSSCKKDDERNRIIACYSR